jgi:signal transduction histidine kinase
MINKELLESLDANDKEQYLSALDNVIKEIDSLEKEYNESKRAYESLQKIIEGIIEVLPNAIWIFNNNNEIFLSNSEAKKNQRLLEMIPTDSDECEIEDDNNFYLIKVKRQLEKVIIVATDITEQRRKERLISMGQMAAHMAHEIRNPIGSVALLTYSLLKKVDVNAKPIVFEIKKSIWRVERIVKATLLFTKGIHLNTSVFSLEDIEDEIENSIGYYTYSKEIEFDFDLPKKDIYADMELLSIVFQNFIFNAIDAIEEIEESDSGKIDIKYDENDTHHIFRVYDTGVPIMNPNLLFEAYKTTKTKGNGLGLVLSLQIIKSHGGDIKVFNDDKKYFEITIKKVSE